MSARTCCSCPATLGDRNRSGLCRSCVARRNNANPVVIANRAAAIRRHYSDPVIREKSRASIARYMANMPEAERERRRLRGYTCVEKLTAASRAMSPEVRAENGRKRSETVMAWCPPEWRPKYRELTSRGFRAPRARQIIADLIAGRPEPVKWAQQRACLAWLPVARRAEYDRVVKAVGAAEARRIIEADMTPFERQLARVAAGAQLVARPDTRAIGPTMTLGGIASADF